MGYQRADAILLQYLTLLTLWNIPRIEAIVSNVTGIMWMKRWAIAAFLVGIFAIFPAPSVKSKLIHPTAPQKECVHCCYNRYEECMRNQGGIFSKDPKVCKEEYASCDKGCWTNFCECCSRGLLGCSGSRFNSTSTGNDDPYGWCGLEGTHCSGPSPPCRR